MGETAGIFKACRSYFIFIIWSPFIVKHTNIFYNETGPYFHLKANISNKAVIVHQTVAQLLLCLEKRCITKTLTPLQNILLNIYISTVKIIFSKKRYAINQHCLL